MLTAELCVDSWEEATLLCGLSLCPKSSHEKKKKRSKRNVSTSSLCQIATSSSDLKLRKDVSHCSLPKENQNKTKPIKCCNLYKIQLQFFFLKKLCVLSEYYLIMELRRKVETEAITTSRALLLD